MATLGLRFELHQPGQKSLSWPPGENSFSWLSPVIVVYARMVYSVNLRGQPVYWP